MRVYLYLCVYTRVCASLMHQRLLVHLFVSLRECVGKADKLVLLRRLRVFADVHAWLGF